MKRAGNALYCRNLLKSATCMDINFILHKNFFVYTNDDKPEMTMPKQIDVKVTKSQKKTRTWKNSKIVLLRED